MSAETIIRCDGPGCKEMKREGNHWLVGVVRKRGGSPEELYASLCPIEGKTIRDESTFCGVPCALRKIQELLEQMMAR